ncbi:MAG: hypothetical protein AB1571_00445 [Nanoarchaeota archaeon]
MRKKRRYYDIKFILVIALAIIVLVNLILTFNITPKEKSIKIKIINDLNCKECFNLANAVDFKDVNVKKQEIVDYSSSEGKKLIEKYNLSFIPSIVITGDIEGVNLDEFEKIEDYLVLTKAFPPYRELSSGSIRGLVSLTYINVSCKKCASVYSLVNDLKQYGIKFARESVLDYKSTEGQELIDKYGLTKVPTIILDSEAGVYDIIKTSWKSIGRTSNGVYVLNAFPPYFDLAEDTVKGLVDVTYVEDKECNSCYNVSLHKQVLNGFGVVVNDEREVDINEEAGRDLLLKYDITLVPTIILSKDADEYARLKSVWPQVGTIEDDGAYVFRKVDIMGTYKDLGEDKVINITK